MSVASGALVDATDGRQVATGALQTAHRYIACENVQATITCTQAGTLLLSAGAYVTRYVDVPATAWYAPYVEYATVNKLMSGIGNRCFSPDTVLTRGMFVTVLGQLAQIDEDAIPAHPSTTSKSADGTPPLWSGPRSMMSSAAPETDALSRTRRSRASRWRRSSPAMCRAPVRRSRRSPTLSCSRTWMRSPAGRLRAWSLCA